MLLTRERVNALSRISRYAGWTNRQFNVLEHSLIGARLLADEMYDHIVQKSFMLHDMHETQFGGDITSPIKTEYMPNRYHLDVAAWDAELAAETGVPVNYAVNARMDKIMLAAETRTVFTGNWKAPIPDGCHDSVNRGIQLIESRTYMGFFGVEAWWQMWAGN